METEGVKKGSIIENTGRKERQIRTRTGRIIVLISSHYKRHRIANEVWLCSIQW